MWFGQLKTRLRKMTVYLELVLAVFITVGIIIGMIDLFKYIYMIYTTNAIETYDVFQRFLGHVLLLVVGVELVAMLIMHTPGSVLEVLLYAVARNMLIGSKEMTDFILGVVSIAAIFAIRRFLFINTISENEGVINAFSAETSIKQINEATGVHIPYDLADNVGSLVAYL
ncbi:MAG: phosphate-starvation-inducible PsiE family protein, partial [Caulobacteraceae bacterium]